MFASAKHLSLGVMYTNISISIQIYIYKVNIRAIYTHYTVFSEGIMDNISYFIIYLFVFCCYCYSRCCFFCSLCVSVCVCASCFCLRACVCLELCLCVYSIRYCCSLLKFIFSSPDLFT